VVITGTFGRSTFTLGSISSPVMHGMSTSDNINISEGQGLLSPSPTLPAQTKQIHHEALGSQILPEMLLEHVSASSSTAMICVLIVFSADYSADLLRGRLIMNSV
jgi:hypothetical protein